MKSIPRDGLLVIQSSCQTKTNLNRTQDFLCSLQAFGRAQIWVFSLPSLTSIMHDPSQDRLFERRSNVLEFFQIHHNKLTYVVLPENLKRNNHHWSEFSQQLTRVTNILDSYGIEWKELVSQLILRNPGERQHALFAKTSDDLFNSRKM